MLCLLRMKLAFSGFLKNIHNVYASDVRSYGCNHHEGKCTNILLYFSNFVFPLVQHTLLENEVIVRQQPE